MNRQRQEVQIRHYVQVDPPTPEFRILEKGSELSFIPLDAVWPDGNGNTSGRAAWDGDPKSYTQFRRGDILLPKVSPTFSHGRVMIADTDTALGLASSEVYALRPHPQVDPRFISYALRSTHFLDEGTAAQTGMGGLRRVSTGWVKSYKLPLFSSGEQRRIAEYLDRETGQIDETITRIDKVVDLLEERHQAFVDFCVQNSGKYAPLSLVLEQSQTGPFGTQLSAEEYVSGGIPIINPSHIQDEKILPEKHISVSARTFERLKRFTLSEGDLVLGRKGDVRKSALIKASDLPALCGSDSLFLRPDLNQVNPSFLRWWFRSSEAFEHLSTHSVGATLTGLNQEIIQLTRVPLPPLDEQSNIVQHLEEDRSSNALMKEKAQTMRDLLLERRSALITAAVTGKIEV